LTQFIHLTQPFSLFPRCQELRRYATLEMRLAGEETQLNHLQDDAAHALREVGLAIDKFEITIVQSSGEITSKNSGHQ